MTYAVYLPLILPAVLALAARQAGDRLGPRHGAVGLTVAGTCASAATVWALALLVLTLFDDLPSMSARAPGLPEPVPDWVALTATAAITLAVAGAVRDLCPRHRENHRRQHRCRLPRGGGRDHRHLRFRGAAAHMAGCLSCTGESLRRTGGWELA